jgi:hypothetical protein
MLAMRIEAPIVRCHAAAGTVDASLLPRGEFLQGRAVVDSGQGITFLFFHKRLCGPLANSRFHHKPDPQHQPDSRLELAYHKADKAIENIVALLQAA